MPPKRQKTIEEQYQKLSQLEHILLRPDSYVGSIEWQKDWLWTYDTKDESVSLQHLNYVPGLYKIFDEIIVNAADNFERDPEHQTYIKVEIDEKAGWVSVQNNGQGLPVEMHQEHQLYVPEMVFGHLLTSDNYDDDEKKTTGGRNGYGAKLTNIFSTKFEIECADSRSQKKYLQTWEENMKKKGESKILSHKGESFTKITFWPDLKKFGMKKLDKDIVGLMQRRCLDLAGTTSKRLKVHLNGKQIDVKDFKDYIEFYTKGEDLQICHEVCHERWEVAMTVSDGQFQQVSFCNGIATPKGGTHVTHVADQLVEAICKRVNSKNKGGMEIKPYHVKNYLWLFVNCRIENPTFDSQTKETMTLKQAKFGSKCEISESMINKVLKTGIVDMVLQWAKAKEEIDLGKTLGGGGGGTGKKGKRLFSVPKLEDANLAGGRDGRECTLILTEGDSAKSLAVAGLSVVGRDKYGVFPLRGKLLNVRDASFAQTMGNAEIAAITKILGLEPKKVYNSANGLRYGHLMVMTDQDFDGSHIKGLILNLVEHWWPSLFQLPGFMLEFVTPIVKVTKGSHVQHFFTIKEYEQWKEEHNNGKGWRIKYYKGLGTSTTAEAKEYFSHISDHQISFEYTGDEDSQLVDLAFNKKRADDRKDWINGADDEDFVDHSQASLSYSDFVQKELVQFAKYDVMRSIPCVVDGFKPVQRKIMWACFKRNLKSDTKVAQLSGYVSEQSSYHHGEVSLQGAIISLAQNFVGSNNVHLLTPSGQFGTRLQGGKDAASSRYIYTRLEKIARLIFHPADDKLLEYQNDEGQSIEPRWYIPVLPMLLLNGADGIGTGWSTSLPNYSPRDIITNLKRYIRCEPLNDMCPWYNGYKGSIVPSVEKDGWEVVGVIDKRGPTTLEISELPIRRWTQDYKETLQSMLSTDGPGTGQIEDFKEYHTEVTVHFVITVTEAQMANLERVGLEKSFKLRSALSLNNMYFFDKDGKIRKYADEHEIIEDFAKLRLEYYHKRKAHLLRALRQQHEIIREKVRFIRLVIEEKLKVKNRKKDTLIEDLRKNNFRTLSEITEGDDIEVPGGGDPEGGEDAGKKEKKKGGWEYLLGMPLWSLTNERVLDLEAQLKVKQAELENLECTAPEELWDADLDAILDELDELDRLRNLSVREEKAMQATAQKRAGKAMGSSAKRHRAGSSGAGPVSAPPPPLPPLGTSAQGSGSLLLRELQERQLSRTAAEFPGLFDDVVPPGAVKRPPPPPPTADAATAEEGGAPSKPAAASLGSFARKAGRGRGRGRATPAAAGGGDSGEGPPRKRGRGAGRG
mmetsp:Transcript_21318/g.45361  ORF Transcript_21318/g.45361 Transcript_21318/m.45361 type:complete len:1306 (+) Transcript_21318:68-3985(+)